MDRLSHDLNLALEESNCGRQERRKLGLRRRTRSAGNLPAVCVASLLEDGSSSSPPQAPLVTQPLSDSDDPQLNPLKGNSLKTRQYCPVGNFESDSFNENFSPTRPANARRKRKYKKMAVDYADGHRDTSPVEILTVTTSNSSAAVIIQNQGFSPILQVNKKKRILKQERSNAFCGKRKWSHRDRSEMGEMRERSFSGGCSSKSYFFGKSYIDFKSNKKYGLEKMPKFKDKLLNPGKFVLKSHNSESSVSALEPAMFPITPSLPGSSSFNFVYKNPLSKSTTPTFSKITGFKITTDLPPVFNPNLTGLPVSENSLFAGTSDSHSKHHRKPKCHNKSHSPNTLRNPLQFDESNCGMDGVGNEFLSSSSLSSSDSDGVVTNDSDREGDDELTDWPGSEELSVFNKSLNFKTSKSVTNATSKNGTQPTKPMKKEKFLPKHGLSSCKNKYDKAKSLDSETPDPQTMDDDTMMSDSATVLESMEGDNDSKSSILQPHASFTSFSDVKNAGLLGQNTNETFFHSFQLFQENSQTDEKQLYSRPPRSNFSLQKTSSSDLNLSEKSPQSDHYYSEHSIGNANPNEVREIRAGCRRIRDERPGFAILSAANEQLSKFLQDSCQTELKLPCFQEDPEERENLESLAKLYSLELQVEMGRPILRKTCNTTQAIRVEHSRMHHPNFLSDYKRRCYGDLDVALCGSNENSINSVNDLEIPHILHSEGIASILCDIEPRISLSQALAGGSKSRFSSSLVNESLLDPGEID